MEIYIRAKYTTIDLESLVMEKHNKVFGNPPAGSKWVISKNLMNEYFVESQVLRAVEEEQAATPPQRTETIQQ